MPRRARIMLPGIPVHVIQRGNNRAACFVADEDRSFYLFHLERSLRRFDCALHAYCLMTNHVHLLLTAREQHGCAALMKYTGQLQSQYANRTYNRTGSLWESRFRSCLVQSEDYLLSCYRYIELNPVRAALVRHPADYHWSSYGVNASGMASSMVTPHSEYLRLGGTEDERVKAYRALVEAGLDTNQLIAIRSATNGGFALGNGNFVRQIALASGRRAGRGKPGRPVVGGSSTEGQGQLV